MKDLNIFIIFASVLKSSTANQLPKCEHDNLHYLPNTIDCTKYYLCHHGIPVEKSCAPGLHFSNTSGKCMLPSQANCQLSCPEIDEPGVMVFLPNFDDCQRFFACYNGEPNPKFCTDGFLWDDKNNWCNFREKVDCGHRRNLSNDKKLSVDELIELLRKIFGEQYLKNLAKGVKKVK